MHLLKTIGTALCLILASWVGAASSVPQLLSYQGRLTDTNGSPVADGNYDIKFLIYGDSTGGTVLWWEDHTSVAVADGLFNTVLGSVTPLDESVFADPDRYLQVKVNDQPMGQRSRFTSTGYAFRTSTIDGTTGGTVTGNVTVVSDGTILFNGDPLDKAGNFGRIEIGFDTSGRGSIALYEPVDSKTGITLPAKKVVEMTPNGLTMFGETDQDTTLTVAPNGNIVGIGQITMGQNSSPGTQTTVLGFENTANGDSSAIGGGSQNVTNGASSTIAGGYHNTTVGAGSSIGGGSENVGGGNYATIGGGQNNNASGDWGTVPGGESNNADAPRSFAAGFRAKAMHDGSFVWADDTEEDFETTANNQYIIRAAGGVGIGTNHPVGQLDVAGPAGDSTVNLPENSISSSEILDEPGVAGSKWLPMIALVQKCATTVTLTSTTITVPANGYIIVRGTSTLRTTGSTGRNQAYLQVQPAPSTGHIGAEYAVAGAGDYDSPHREHFFSLATERIFPVSAGTYTYLLEGQAHPDNGNSASTKMMQSSITAMFVPTAYGPVTSSGTPVGFGE